MANNIPRQGFKFAYNLYGKSEAQVLAFPATIGRDATGGEIFIGDAIGLLATGFVAPFVSGAACLGVCVGISPSPTPGTAPTATTNMNAAPPYNPEALTQRSLPAGTAGWVYVIPAGGNAFTVLNVSASSLANIGATGQTAGGCVVVGTAGTLTTASLAHGVLYSAGVAGGYTGNSTHAIDGATITNTDFRILAVSNQYIGGGNGLGGQNDPTQVLNQVVGIFKTPSYAQ